MSAARSMVLVLLGLMALVAVLLTPPPAAVLAQSPNTDATLGGLTLSEGRLDPVFATGTTDYAAGVGYTVTRITVVPTTTDANATVAYLDGSDSPLPDANTVTDEQDVDLVVGETVVQVKITAEDTSTLLTYTVTITRTQEDTSLRPTASDPVAATPSSAVYRVTFQGTWTRSVTPGGVPGSAHFTRLVGGVHGDAVTFLESGGTASAGVEYMAENGGASDFNSEVQAAIEATPRTALSVIRGVTYLIGPQVSKTLDNVELTTDFPRVTLTTMVAPSPDWFVGVSGLPLLDDQGRWLRSHEVNLYPWDAGTEDGGEFSLSNAATSPQGVITSIRGTGKFSTEPIASLSFTLESVRTTRSVAENTGPGVSIGAPVVTDSSGPVTYILGGRDAASFDIVEATGQLQTKAALDYERKSSYEVTVTATDPTSSVDIMVAIDVTNVVELQPITGPATVDYEESRAVRVAAYSASSEADLEFLTWSLSGPDAGSFRIDEPGGVLRFDLPAVAPNLFSPQPDYEAPTDTGRDGTYEVTVEVSDGTDTVTLEVTVTITNLDEAGAFSLFPTNPLIGTVVQARLSDPDGVTSRPNEPVWEWARSSDKSTWTAITDFGTLKDISGNVTTAPPGPNYAPGDAETGMYLRVIVAYTDGTGSRQTLQVISNQVVRERAPAPDITIVELVSDLTIPWDLAFTPDGTMLFTERPGKLSARLASGTIQTVTADFSDLQLLRSNGLLAIVVDHDFATNRRFYTCQSHTGLKVQIIAWTISSDYTAATRVADPLVGDIPSGWGGHPGCRLRIGPEGYLWIATGDGYYPSTPQDLGSLAGKILRVDVTAGDGAPGNPFSSRVYSYGHRDPQGLALRPGTTEMWSMEHGPNWDDEINLLVAGANYGWDPADGPNYNHRAPMTDLRKFPDALEAKWSSEKETLAISGGIFLDDSAWGAWNGRLAVAALKAQSLNLFEFDSSGTLLSHVVVPELHEHYGRLRTPMTGPDGALYVTTSNGTSLDYILKVVPSLPPQFSAEVTTQSVEENRGASTVVATVTAIDPEGGAVTYTLGGGEDARSFNIANPDIGEVRADAPLDYETKSSYTVDVIATDPWGLDDAITLTINVENIDEPPATTTRSVAENTAAVMDIGAPVTATTVGPAVTYALGGTDAASFDIVEATGQLQTKAALDYETRSSYEVTVTATNSEGSVDITVTIDVTNVIELQPITGPATVDYEESRAVRVAAYSASSEADLELLTWSLSGPDAGSFRIDEPGGVLRFDLPVVAPNLFSPQPDYEAPTDTGNDGTYEVTVEVGDGVGSHSLAVAVTITDQDEAGTLTLSTTRPQFGVALTTTLTDPDGVSGTVTYRWERSAGRSAWTDIVAAAASSYTPTSAETGHFLRVTATYTDRHGSGRTATASTSEVVAGPLLTALTLSTVDATDDSSHGMRPAFDRQTLHYGIGCTETGDTMTVTATAPAGARLSVNGIQVASGVAFDVEVAARDDVRITLAGPGGERTTYVAHCLTAVMTAITTVIAPDATGVIEDLIIMAIMNRDTVAIVDPNGVPRFYRHDTGRRGGYVRIHQSSPDYKFRYSYFDSGQGQWILLDEHFEQIGTADTSSPLTTIDRHDFRILEDGNYMLMAYERAPHDLSHLTFGNFGTSVTMADSVIQIQTPDGTSQYLWNSFDGMALEDCVPGFPPDKTEYAHLNTMAPVDGHVIASFRLCNSVLRIDPNQTLNHGVVWRVGLTNLTDEEWEQRDIGPPPLKLIGDPVGQFCGQHGSQLLPTGNLLLYDNGALCMENPWTEVRLMARADFSRAVEYDIDAASGEAIFIRDHSLRGERRYYGFKNGTVQPLENGDWLVSWGVTDNLFNSPPEPVTQVDPDTGEEKFSLVWPSDSRLAANIRAIPLSPVALADDPVPLRAEFLDSGTSSSYEQGGPPPTVVIAFNQPVADFDQTTPSLSVTGATVASVSAHVVAGEPANAYLVSLTPDGDGAITFGLLADQACAGGGICAADGTTLSEAPSAPVTIDVTNIIELQPLTGPATVEYEENRAARVATFSASSEADRELVGWSLSGPDADSFRIDEPGGVLRFDLPVVSPNLFSPQPDFEAPTDTGNDGTYEVTVEVGDGVTTHSLDVAVTITDQDEAGTLTLSPTRPRQAEPVTATLSDPDTVTGTPDWTWERSAGRSAWHVINGASASSYTPTAADAGHYLRVSTSYTDDHGSGKTARTVAPNVVLARTLSRLEVVTTSSRQLYPAFDPGTLHYAVGCVAADTLRLTLSTTDADTRLAVDGVQYANQNAVVELTGKGGESDILITLSGGSDGASTTYTIHCLAEDFPTISVERLDGASESLMTVSYGQYLAIIDHNGVPRFREQGRGHFRAYPDGAYPYAVYVRADSAYTVYDGTFNVVQSGITTVNLHDTNSHDFFIKPNGEYVLIAYEPAVRDLSFISDQFGLTNEDGEPYGTAEDAEDSVIQVVTPDSQEVFLWNSWDHMALEDCTQHRFPDDYSHINSLQVVDGDIVASFRGCSKVLRIDGTSGEVIWRLGRSNLSTEEWESRSIGPPPLKIVGDPYGEFCGQHAARLLDNGHLILFDNGVQCLEDPRTGGTARVGDQFSRVVEYAIDLEQGEAIFQRHVFLHGSMNHLSYAMGQADALDNGNWLITWGRGARAPNPGDPPAPDVSATQVNPATGVEELTVVARIDGDVQTQGRMYPVAPVALAAEPIALTAEFPASTYTSIFHLGATDEPQVVVSFSRPVVDFDETTPSFSVSGAEVASVSAHVVAGEPAHAYLVTLTPDGYGPITFRLLTYQACADGGICTADGTQLTEVPSAPLTIQTFVAEVSIEPGPSPVTEGADVTFTLTRNGPLTAELTVNVNVAETGSMLSGALPASATFGVGADTTTLTLTTEDDAPIEDPSTVTVTIEADAGARYQAAPGAATADVVVLDDLPRFLLKVGPAEVTEGGGGAVTVEVTNSVSLATAETISLTLSGTATADDFTLLSTSDRTLSAPYALTIPANEGVAAAYISTVNDALSEPAETLTITASHDGTDIGTGTMTLRASSQRLELSSLTASGGGGRAMYPSFDPGTLHYAVGCDPAQTLTLRLSTTDATTRLAVNGVQQVNQNAVVELNQLDGDDDILITLSDAAGASTTYVVHCMNSDDPFIDIVKQPGSAIELIAGSVSGMGSNADNTGHLLLIDANGVPRVHRRVVTPRVNHLRPQDHPDFAYSYAELLPERLHTPWGTRGDFEVVILDRGLNEVRRVRTTADIPQTNQHDFLIKPNGNFILIAYAAFEHDLSEFVDRHGSPYGTMALAEDSLIEEVTPAGDQVFYWSTYDHLYLGDCALNQFPADYAHLNSLQLVDGEDLVISLRNCSQILRIDGISGDVQWRLGSSYRSDAEWEALGLQPPLRIIGDPYVEFCGQHSAKLMPNGHLLLYDNGYQCPLDPATGLPRRPEEEFSRVVEYALDLDQGTATFVRHHSLRNSFSFFNQYRGRVAPMVNDSWLISWGFSEPRFTNRPDTAATEYNPTTKQELLSLTIKRADSGDRRDSHAYPLGFEALEQPAEPLAAALPESAHTSVFTFGQTDTPTVVVAFSEPVKDFATDTPSMSVTGATIASVAAHIAAGEPANVYLFTLTPAGDGPITLRLVADQSCSSGGICTADGARLSVVPDAFTIEAPVRVSFTQESFTASEGASALIVVILSAPSGPFGITIPIVVTGGTASADEYRAPEQVVFSSGSDRQTISIPLGDDALIEGDETIALAFGDLPTGVTPGTNATTTVTITDADSATFGFAISDDEVGEGATVGLTVTLDGDATFAAAQTIELTFQGGGATSGVDFTVADSSGQALTAPYALTLPAGASSVVATISIVDDAEEEGNETIVVSARHGADALGGPQFITILANDAPPPPTNSPPVFTEGRSAARSLAENTGPNINIGRPLAATDVDQGDTLTYSLGGTDAGSFDISLTSGQLLTRSGVTYDHEEKDPYEVTVSVSDGEATASIDVTIAVTDVDEPPAAPVVQVDTASPVSLNVTWLAPATPGRPAVSNYDLRYKLDSETGFTDGPQDVSGTSTTIGELIPASSYGVQVRATNAEGDGPWSASQPGETAVLPVVALILSASSIPENRGMSTVTATVSPASPTPFSVEIWAAAFPPIPGQFETSLNNILSFAANETESTGEVVITGLVATVVNVTGTLSPAGVLVKPPARVQLRITAGDTDPDPQPEPIITGGGGGGGGGPTPSDADFEWNVERDIEALDSGHDTPSGLWSDGATIWLLENGDGADDAVYAYDLVTGERVEDREFELDETNRAPRGVASDGVTMWIADSGRDTLFAHDLASGERLAGQDVALHRDNADPRGIWSDGVTMWVLDGGKNALFGYDLESGELIAEHALDSGNDDPRGLWSDGVTVWVSDHGAKRLFAYRLPARPEAPAAEDAERQDLERVIDEEFKDLPKASNNSPRGIWSDGDVMYVADASDAKVYSYNLPDAIDARLASLTLSGVQFGEFLPRRTEYEGVADEGVTETTVEAVAVQSGAEVAIDPPDADEATDGHQLALDGVGEITITVTSADESRTKVYQVRFGGASEEPSAAACLRGAVGIGFSLVVSEGGSVEDLAACAQSRHVTALYALAGGEYVSYILGAPDFVNREFSELFSDDVPPLTPLVAASNGPPSSDPNLGDGALLPGPECLRGDIATGFSLVLYEGGSVEALDTCAQGRDVTALYALDDGEWVSYILGAPEFVNREFRKLFADGLPAVMPLIAKSEGPPLAN